MRKQLLSIFILLLFHFLSFTNSSPLRSQNVCGPSSCKGEDGKFQYKKGSVYSYHYIVNSTNLVLGGPPTQSGLHLSAKVSLRFITACDVILFIKNVSILQSHSKDSSLPTFTSPTNRLTFINSLEEHPLRFSYADGLIEEICPQPADSDWALNIKRGFLSAFQNTMRRLDLEYSDQEDDVHGHCKVQYSLGTATSSALTIGKSKDLNSCGDRFGTLSSIKGTPYNFGTFHKSMPFIESSTYCEQTVDRNLVSGVSCREFHGQRTLAPGAAGAQIKILQTMELVSVYQPTTANANETVGESDFSSPFGEEDEEEENEEEEEDEGNEGKKRQKVKEDEMGNAPWTIIREADDYISTLISGSSPEEEIIARRESLRFKHDYSLGGEQATTDYNIAKKALENFCTSIKEEVIGGSGEYFESLIYILRGLSPSDMMSLSKDATQICQGDRETFEDALETVGTSASVAVMREKILKSDASFGRIKSWINSLNFIAKPDLSLLTEAVSILKARDNYPNILLSFSNMAHAYCQHKDVDVCSKHQPVLMLAKLYEKYFAATGCLTRKRKDLDQALMYLKGLGNFGLPTNGTIQAITTCLTKNENSAVKVASIEAMRRMPCGYKGEYPELKSVFENQQEDSEVRIAAFISIVRCLNYPTVRWLKKVLNEEKVNQVGSFVWSYLTNLQKTSLPSKGELQGLLSDEELTTKFKPDIRKFSRNYELSTFQRELNLGVGLDGNLIFSQNSYLPRSLSANLTVDLFGESINVFEATMRIENFEKYLESMLIPNTNSKEGKKSPKRRGRRAALNKKKMRSLAIEYGAMKRHNSDPTTSLSFRSFGKEIYFGRFVGLQEQKDAISGLKSWSFLNSEDTNWGKSSLLVDSSYIIPTGVGFPLNLSAQASTIFRMESQSLIDSNFSGFKLKGKFIPSALLSVVGSMSLSASDIHTGLKIKAHLRSSTALQATFHLEQPNLIDVEFGLPKSQLELLEYKSELMFMEGDEFRPVTSSSSGSGSICIGGNYFAGGLKVCSSGGIGDPLAGRSEFSLTLYKTNPSLLKTRFHYVWNNNQSNTNLILESTSYIGENRDNAKENKLGLDFSLNKINMEIDGRLSLPQDMFAKLKGNAKNGVWDANLNLDIEQRDLSIFSTSASLKRESDSGGRKWKVKPRMSVKGKRKTALYELEGEIEVFKMPDNSQTFSGKGEVELVAAKKKIGLKLNGGINETSIKTDVEAVYERENVKLSYSLTKEEKRDAKDLVDSNLSLEFSQFPFYNLETSWKYQRGEEGASFDGSFSQGPPTSSKSSIVLSLLSHRTHEGSRNKGSLQLIQLSQGIDWKAGGSLVTQGKSFESTINLRYAPGKNVDTSFWLKRSPGLLTSLEIGGNLTLPTVQPVQISFMIKEPAYRTYQVQMVTDWSLDKVILDGEYSDRSRRSRLDSSISLGLSTSSIPNLKLGFHVMSEDKESKIQLSSDYKSHSYAVELGHSQVGKVGGRHKLIASLTSGDQVYIVMSDVDLEHGFQAVIKTLLGPSFSDIYARISATNGMQQHLIGMEYRWDVNKEEGKSLLLQLTFTRNQEANSHALATQISLPGFDSHGNVLVVLNPEDEGFGGGSFVGSIGWRVETEERGHLHLNGRFGPRVKRTDDDDDGMAYDATINLSTPFTFLKNISANLGLDCLKEVRVCQIKFDSSWKDSERLDGTLVTKFIEEEEIDSISPDDDENEIVQNSFRFSLEGNMTSTLHSIRVVNIKLNHVFNTYLNTKTDLDIELPNEKEISVSSQWVLPRRFKDLLSTRAELHIKTPFVGYQNVDLQIILGRKEDKDVLALIGIYVENFQYAISITGTPRFEEDGALGFDVTTSNPKYDKIFGSFSYVIGDTTRLACQLGWPQVVIGIETGWEWVSWEDFQLFYTFTSPWSPLKNTNALFKVDGSQFVELKVNTDEDSLNAKCQWNILSWTNYDIRLDGNSPFESGRKFGFLFKNFWEDEVAYESRAVGWLNEQQVGYKLEGGQSEVEEETLVAIVMHSLFEFDSFVYPTIRGQFSLAQRESRFNLTASLNLREGPINIGAQLELLDVYRFNENITVSTPYPGLHSLEIALSPAILYDKGLYNLAIDSKWRSHSEDYKGGLFVRLGPQGILSEILTQEAQNAAFFNPNEEEEYVEAESIQVDKVEVPNSQLFHFYSPIDWAKEVRFEYEPLVQDEEDDQNIKFPIKKFALGYTASFADLRTEIDNGDVKKIVTGVMDIRNSALPRISFKLDGLLDLSEPEGKFHILAASYHPTTREYSLVSSWTEELPQFLQGKVEVRSPIGEWEEQSGSLMYAHNEEDETFSVDLELVSLAFEKLATNVMAGPRTLSMTMNTPFEGFEEIEVKGDNSVKEDDEQGTNTLIVMKCGEKEVEIDIDSDINTNGWPTKIKGTLTSNLGLGYEAYRNGELVGNVLKTENALNASIDWMGADQKFRATVYYQGEPQDTIIEQLFINIDTGKNQEWELNLNRKPIIEDSQREFIFSLKSPAKILPSADGAIEYELGNSVLEMRKLYMKVEGETGSFSSNNSWTFSSLSHSALSTDTKYSLKLSPDYKILANAPKENGIKFKFKHFIETFPNVDSRFMFECIKPAYKLGAGIQCEFVEGESLNFKLIGKHGKTNLNANFSSTFDENFKDINANLELNSTKFVSNSKLEVHTNHEDKALVGMSSFGYGADKESVSSLDTSFNCSWSDISQFHLRLGFPSPKVNKTLPPLISIDGSFNRISARHSARVEIGQNYGNDEPITASVELMTESLYNFETALNFTTNVVNASRAGIHFANMIEGSEIEGILGGHLEDDEFYTKYFWDYERNEDLLRFNLSLDTQVPISTESVPKPQTAIIVASYMNSQSLPTPSTSSSFEGSYNGVQLLNTVYKKETKSVGGRDEDKIEFSLDNHFLPFGLHNLDVFEYNGGYEGQNLPTKMVRVVRVYDLRDPDLHKLEGELQIKTNFTGKEITLTGRHPNQSIELITSYDHLDHQFRHTTRIGWKPNSWLGYDLDVFNKTNNDEGGSELNFRLTYPIRVITLKSGYKASGSSLKWTNELNFNALKKGGKNHLSSVLTLGEEDLKGIIIRKLGLELNHPSLGNGLRAEGRIETDGWDFMEGKVSLDYASDLNKGVTLVVRSRPRFNILDGVFYWNATLETELTHPATKLDVKSRVSTINSGHELSIISLIDFKNGRKIGPSEFKMAFELFKQLRKAEIMLYDPEDTFGLECVLSGEYPRYELKGEANVSSVFPNPQGKLDLDLDTPKLSFYLVHGKDLTNGIFAKGGVIDSRNVRFDIWENYDNSRFSDVSYFLRLNHSKLVTSKLQWRPELVQEIKDYCSSTKDKLRSLVASKGEQLISSLSGDASDSLADLWNDAKGTIGPFLAELKEDCDFRSDFEALTSFFEEMYNNNEFYLRDIAGYSQLIYEEILMRSSKLLEKLKPYQENLEKYYLTLQEGYKWVEEKIKDAYNQLVTAWENYKSNPFQSISIPWKEIKEKVYIICYYSVGILFKSGELIYTSLRSLASSLISDTWAYIHRYQSHIVAHIQQIEDFMNELFGEVSDYYNSAKEDIMKSQYYQKLSQFLQELQTWNFVFQNDAVTNIKVFYRMLKTFLARKLSEMDEFVTPLRQLGQSFWENTTSSEFGQTLRQVLEQIWAKIQGFTSKSAFSDEDFLEDLFISLRSLTWKLFSSGATVLEAASSFENRKTKFIFDSDKGLISLEQKLPMPWGAFNETPDFKKLPEYQNIIGWQDFIKKSKGSIWDIYYKSGEIGRNSFPPFDGHAMLVGSEYFLTFDGFSYYMKSPSGNCNYLLVADLVDGNFSVALHLNNASGMDTNDTTTHNLLVTVAHNTLIFDIKNKGLRDPRKGNQLLNLPIQTPNLRAYQEGPRLVVESQNGITVSCNVIHQICQFHVSGWYSRKVGGLLGTMDYEPSTDLILSNGKIAPNIQSMVTSWKYSDEGSSSGKCLTQSASLKANRNTIEARRKNMCLRLFYSKLSTLQPCFDNVKSDPFYEMCLMDVDICTSAVAYLTSCKTIGGLSLKTPSICGKCEMNGEEMMDRDMKVISSPPTGSPSFLSADIVLIVEAKQCNRAIRSRRKIDILIKHLEEELARKKFTRNRYAAVLFGGDGVLDKPRSVVQNKEEFTNATNIGKYLASLPIGNGNRDIFNGIWYSLQNLNFRPGVRKSFILLPCSSCQPEDTKVDYTDLYYAMLEQGTTLHILMDGNFTSENRNLGKNLFGIDSKQIYANAATPISQKKGETNLRKQIKVGKSVLGYCAPLALQTNGSIFLAKKLHNKKESVVKSFTGIFATRVAENVIPSPCQTCYCSSTSQGVGKLECFECGYTRYEPKLEEDDDEVEESVEENELISETQKSENRKDIEDENEEEEDDEDEDEEDSSEEGDD